MSEIQHDSGSFFIESDGKRIAEMVYKQLDATTINIVHTEVDASLRGQGVARKLLDALAAWARSTGTKVAATCPYAKKEFERDPSLADIKA